MDQENLITQFMGVTQTSEDFARSFLESSGWSLEDAVNSYLGVASGQSPSHSNSAPELSAREKRLQERTKDIMNEQGVDEYTARAIAEAQGEPIEAVRAPISSTTERIIPGVDQHMRAHAQIAHLMARDARVDSGGLASAGFGNDYEAAGLNPTSNLQRLLSVPGEVVFAGSWEDAKSTAERENKWLLVNIQKDSEFLSFILNRDIWANDIVKDMLTHRFVFFQQEETDPITAMYKAYYAPQFFPHIAILDPATGEQMLTFDLERFRLEQSDLLMDFLDKVNTFLDNHVLEGERSPRQAEAAVHPEPHQDADVVIESDDEISLGSIEVLEYSDIEEEPTGSDVTTLQLRLPENKPLRRKFRKSAKVSEVFSFVRKTLQLPKAETFDLIIFPNRSLSQIQDKTLSEGNILNTAIRYTKT